MSNITTDFITATKKIHGEVRAILTTLHIIRDDVKSIKEQGVKSTGTIDTNTEAQTRGGDPAGDVTNRTATHLDTRRYKREKQQTTQEQRTTLQELGHKWIKHLSKPKTQIEIVVLSMLITYTCETHRTNELTQKSLALNRESIMGRIAFGDWDLGEQVIPGKEMFARFDITNTGHMPVLYGMEGITFYAKDLPKGDIPIEAPKATFTLEPNNIPVSEKVVDHTILTEEMIYDLPHLQWDMSVNPATRHPAPPLRKSTIFFVSRVVYESLGKRTERQFCRFIVFLDQPLKPLLPGTKTDPRFTFFDCPKWNDTIETEVH